MKKHIIFIFTSVVASAQNPKIESADVTEKRATIAEEVLVAEDEKVFERDMENYPVTLRNSSLYNRIVKTGKDTDYTGNDLLIEQGQNMYSACKTFYETIVKDLKTMTEKEAIKKSLYDNNYIKVLEIEINRTLPRDLNVLVDTLVKYDLSKYITVIDNNASFDSTTKFENFKDFQNFLFYMFDWNRYSLIPDMNSNLMGHLTTRE